MIANADNLTDRESPAAPDAVRSLRDLQTARRTSRQGRRTFESASFDRFNEHHFGSANGYDAAAAIRPSLQTLRNRCRYEFYNNSLFRGIAETHANDVVGIGPRLQMQSASPDLNRAVESAFGEFADHYCDAAGKLDLAAILQVVDLAFLHTGSILLRFIIDRTASTDIKLRIQVIEADRLQTPWDKLSDDSVRDGVKYDVNGRPTHYYILKHHPGDTAVSLSTASSDFDEVPAGDIIHAFRPDRPGQTTAPPMLSPSLQIFSALRDYTMSVLRAARRAATFSGVLETTSTEVEVDTSIETMDEVEVADDTLLTLPTGWRLSQLDAAQPTVTYADFKHECLGEAARCINMPFNMAAANSGGYNFASGRLDDQIWVRTRSVLRRWLAREVCYRILTESLKTMVTLSWFKRTWWKLTGRYPKATWFWPGHGHVDPIKDANAQAMKLKSKTTTLAAEYAAQGLDWETELKQYAKELAAISDLETEYGVKFPEHIAPSGRPDNDKDDEPKDDDKNDDPKDDDNAKDQDQDE